MHRFVPPAFPRRSLSSLLAALACLLLFGARPAGAEVLLDREGRLEEGDERLTDGSLADRFEIPVRAGDRIVVTLTSSDFDAYLIVHLPDGTTIQDDDGAGGTNARVEAAVPRDGTLRIEANALAAGDRGRYRLVVERLGAGPGEAGSRSETPRTADDAPAAPGTSWITGRLAPGDETLDDGSYIDLHTFEGRRGERVVVSMFSDDFDAFLMMTGPDGFERYDDDGAGGTNARIAAVLPADGTYTIAANSYGDGPKEGTYRIRIVRGEGAGRAGDTAGDGPAGPSGPAAPGAAPPLRFGRPVEDRLAPGDLSLDDGSYYDRYRFEGRAGQPVVLTLSSDDFDPILFLIGPGGFSEMNDDADGRNSRIETVLPEDGEYTVVVNSYGEGAATGRYRLEARAGGAVRQPAGPRLLPGEVRTGELGAGDPTLSSGEYYDRYAYEARAGERLVVTMTSREFDPYLLIRGPDDFAEDNDDLAEGNPNARLDIEFPRDGTYFFYATSYEPGMTGAYRLVASREADAPAGRAPPSVGRLRAGDEVRGALSGDDGTLESGEFYDLYELEGRAGEAVTITLLSDDFDPYLFVRGPADFAEDNDDISQTDRNARLALTLPADGTYRVVVTSYHPGEEGRYRIRVTRGIEGEGPTAPDRPEFPGGPDETGGEGLAERRRVFGIFVGISDYPGSENDLPFCARDAAKLHDELVRVGVLDRENAVLLTDGAATVRAFRDAVRRIVSRAAPRDVVLLFYSGHGHQRPIPAPRGRFDLDRKEEMLILHDGPVTDAELAEWLDGLSPRILLVALDACFSGGFNNLIDRPGRMGLFSSEEDLTSAVPEKFQAGGYLSEFLRRGLLGASDFDRDNRVTAGELAEYLRRMYAQEVTGVEAETLEGARSYQHLVVDRGGGAVKVTDEIISLAGVRPHLKYPVAAAGTRGALRRPAEAGLARAPRPSGDRGHPVHLARPHLTAPGPGSPARPLPF